MQANLELAVARIWPTHGPRVGREHHKESSRYYRAGSTVTPARTLLPARLATTRVQLPGAGTCRMAGD
jgi:hypothetical protein